MMTSFYLDSSDCYEWYPKIGMFENNCFWRKTNKMMIILLTFRRNTCMGNVLHLVLLYISSTPHRECRKNNNMNRRKQHHLAGSSFSPLCNICMVSNLFAMQWEPRETISHGGIWTTMQHCCLLQPCSYSWWCHLPAFAPMPAMHAHACNIPSSDAGLLNPRTEELLPLLSKKAAISTFYLVSNHHPKLIALNFIHETNFFSLDVIRLVWEY